MNGDLAEGVVPDLLREIYVGRRNGTLTLVRGDERQSLRFRRGHIVNAHTNVLEERLGEMLVRRGLLAEADLARATEIVVRDGRRLGEVLAELGLIDANGLEDAVALHVHEMLAKVFLWHEGSFGFEEEPEAEGGQELTLKLSTGELILEAVQAVRDPDVVRYALGDMDRVLALSSDPLLRFQKLTLSPEDGFVLSRVDGVTSAHEIVQMIPLPAERTQRSLLGLLSTGVVEFVARPSRKTAPAGPGERPREASAARAPGTRAPAPRRRSRRPAPPEPPAPAPRPEPADEKTAERRREILEAWDGLKTRTHFEVLGLSRAVGEAEVKDAYFRLAKRFHPDVHHGASLGDLRDELEAVFIRLGEAYDVLRDPRQARRLRGAPGTVEAETGSGGRRRAPGRTPSPPRPSPRATRRRKPASPRRPSTARPSSSSRRSTGTPSSCSSRRWRPCRASRACAPACSSLAATRETRSGRRAPRRRCSPRPGRSRRRWSRGRSSGPSTRRRACARAPPRCTARRSSSTPTTRQPPSTSRRTPRPRSRPRTREAAREAAGSWAGSSGKG